MIKDMEYFKIKWANYDLDECTWEPASNIKSSNIIQEFIDLLREEYRSCSKISDISNEVKPIAATTKTEVIPKTSKKSNEIIIEKKKPLPVSSSNISETRVQESKVLSFKIPKKSSTVDSVQLKGSAESTSTAAATYPESQISQAPPKISSTVYSDFRIYKSTKISFFRVNKNTCRLYNNNGNDFFGEFLVTWASSKKLQDSL